MHQRQAPSDHKTLGAQDPLLVYAMSGMSLNNHHNHHHQQHSVVVPPPPTSLTYTSPSAPMMMATPVLMATPRPDLEVEEQEDLDVPPPPYTATAGRTA